MKKRSTEREVAFKTIYSRIFNADDNDEFENADVKGLEFTYGIWLLYILIMKPILMIFRGFDNHIYKGWLWRKYLIKECYLKYLLF